ncbi:hypothetical protein AB0C74_31190, partial [Spirillospora sp. NPDC048832]
PPLTLEPLRPLSAAFVGQAPPALCPTRRPHPKKERTTHNPQANKTKMPEMRYMQEPASGDHESSKESWSIFDSEERFDVRTGIMDA